MEIVDYDVGGKGMKIKKNETVVYEDYTSSNMIESFFKFVEAEYKITIVVAMALVDGLLEEGKSLQEIIDIAHSDIGINDYVFWDVDEALNEKIYVFPERLDPNGQEAVKWCTTILNDIDRDKTARWELAV